MSERVYDVGKGYVRARECPDCGHTRCGEGCNCNCDAARAEDEAAHLRERLTAAEAERDRYRSALRDVAREWPYLDLIDPQTAQECNLRGLVEYLLGAVRSEQRVAREALEGQSDA